MLLMSISLQARAMAVIRDTEIEAVLETWAEPIYQAAGMNADQVDIILVDSSEVNAFVAGGANIFIFAGLIQAADYPEEIIGVIAHELGHIQAGHLIEKRRAADRATYQSIFAAVAGVGAAIATGEGGAATAVTLGGSGAATGGFLSHSRTQESAADQAALRYLIDADINPNGLVTFLEKLQKDELLPAARQNAYMRTHPLTRDRIEAMRQGASQAEVEIELGETGKQATFDRVKAKLRAFREPHMVQRYYDSNSETIPDLYAHAIMHYRQKDYDQAIELFNAILVKEPNNPAILEMKAQTYRDSGQLEKARVIYEESLAAYDTPAPLVKANLAQVLTGLGDYGLEVENLLLSALAYNKNESYIYRLLATVKGRNDREADARYYLAEEAAMLGNRAEAKRLLSLALADDTLDDTLAVKAQDLQKYLDSLPKG